MKLKMDYTLTLDCGCEASVTTDAYDGPRATDPWLCTEHGIVEVTKTLGRSK